jgi:hypothetical protein
MRLFEETGSFIDAFAFEKDATYGFKRLSIGSFVDWVNVVDNGAIQVSLQQIIATFVYGHFTVGLIHVEFEVYVSSLHELDSGGWDQVQAISKINHCADCMRLFYLELRLSARLSSNVWPSATLWPDSLPTSRHPSPASRSHFH